jgi:hypothetical protein
MRITVPASTANSPAYFTNMMKKVLGRLQQNGGPKIDLSSWSGGDEIVIKSPAKFPTGAKFTDHQTWFDLFGKFISPKTLDDDRAYWPNLCFQYVLPLKIPIEQWGKAMQAMLHDLNPKSVQFVQSMNSCQCAAETSAGWLFMSS